MDEQNPLNGSTSPSDYGGISTVVNESANGGSITHSNRFVAGVKQFSERMTSFIEEHTGEIGMLGSFSIAVNSLGNFLFSFLSFATTGYSC